MTISSVSVSNGVTEGTPLIGSQDSVQSDSKAKKELAALMKLLMELLAQLIQRNIEKSLKELSVGNSSGGKAAIGGLLAAIEKML